MTPEQRAELRRLCEEAKEGPWVVDDDNRLCVMQANGMGPVAWTETCIGMESDMAGAQFIAASRTALPALLDHVETLEEKDLEWQRYARRLEREIERLEKENA